MMMPLVLLAMFCIGTIGLTNILVHGRILDVIYVRPFAEWLLKKVGLEAVLTCYECMGFWSGLLNGIIWCPLIFGSWSSLWLIPIVISAGWAGSVLSATYMDVMYIIRANIQFEVPDETERE
jgi:hypothetical protein